MKTFIEKEQEQWKIENHKGAQKNTYEKIDFNFNSLTLCYKMDKHGFKKYFLRDEKSIMLFEVDDVSKKIIMKIEKFNVFQQNFPKIFASSDMTKETTFTLTDEVIERIETLASRCITFSYALRNTEHLARYIYSGSWLSFQMSHKGQMWEVFHTWMTPEQKKLINLLPMGIEQVRIRSELYQQPQELSQYFHFLTDCYPNSEVDNSTTKNILFIGVSGAGKSSIINHMFNCDVAFTRSSTKSITKNVQYITGEFRGKKFLILDTIGLCGSEFKSDHIDEVIKDTIKNNLTKIHKIVVVCSEKIQRIHRNSFLKFSLWLDSKSNKENFIFIFNKQEKIDIETRKENLEDLCACFRVYDVKSNLENEKEAKNAFSVTVKGLRGDDLTELKESLLFETPEIDVANLDDSLREYLEQIK